MHMHLNFALNGLYTSANLFNSGTKLLILNALGNVLILRQSLPVSFLVATCIHTHLTS